MRAAATEIMQETTSDSRRWLAFAVLLVGAFLPPLDFFIVNVALPSIQGELGTSAAENMAEGMPSDVPLMVGATSGDYPSLRASLPVFMAQRAATYRSPQYVYRFSRVPDGWSAMGLPRASWPTSSMRLRASSPTTCSTW